VSALYRQARPVTFDEMVGQEHVKEVLLNALQQGKLAQAYLFSGPRGVGKTTSARLIAQAVNCTPPKDGAKPCGNCEGCRLVREGRHPDVLEIDAASNNSVEDVRDLRERILLAPMLSGHKVVILDEAHMMSKSAFNALLKTLEEPPQHVIFVFATTEPERMPPTILSRTQHFRFRRLSEGEIVEKLERILLTLKRQAEPEALGLVARMADGAMRDGESLLDRLLTLEGKLTLKQTENALGLPPQEALFALAEALDQGQVREALELSQRLYTQGFAARSLAQGLLEAIRAGLYARIGLGPGPHLNAPEERLVASMTALDEAMERLLKRSDALALELAVLAAYQAIHTVAVPVEAAPVQRSVASGLPDFSPRPREAQSQRPIAEGQRPKAENQEQAASKPPAQNAEVDIVQEWRGIRGRIKPTVRGLLVEAQPYLEGRVLTVVFPEGRNFHYEGALKNLEVIQTAVKEALGDLEVRIELRGVKKKLVDEPARTSIAFPPKPSAPPLTTPQPQAIAVSPPPVMAEPQNSVRSDTELSPAEQTAQADPPSTLLTLDRAKLEDAVVEPSIVTAEKAAVQPPEKAVQPPEKSEVPAPVEPQVNALHEASPFNEEPLFPEDTPLSEPLEDAEPPGETFFLNDPKFQTLTRMFGGRVRRVYRDKPAEPVETSEGEDGAEAEGPEE
jgi:DNA polymerase-3 subunit gamma/tau